MNIALFGGTFDPVHLGHLLVADAARLEARLDRVIFLPSFRPPHKKKIYASAQHRLAMLRQAVRGNSAFEVSDWEVRQKRRVYTYEALDYFQHRFPRARLHFIMGSDSLRDIPSWRGGAALLKRAIFLIVEREEAPWNSISLTLRRPTRQIHTDKFPFASHVLRAAIGQGKSVRYRLPAGVADYIAQHRLYAKASKHL